MIRPALPMRLASSVVALALVAGACGGDDDASAGGTTSTGATASTGEPPGTAAPFPRSVTSGESTIELAEAPDAIVSLSPSATEMLFGIGAGDQVIAADAYSNYPAEAPVTDLDGNTPNVEALLGYEPDLVVISFDPGDVVSGLDAAGVPTLVLGAAATLDDTYEQIEVLGAATGHDAEATALNDAIRADIEALVSTAAERPEPLTYYHELDDTLYSVTSSTFVGEIYALAGFENIADAADPNGDAGGYPQLSAEYIIEADPDVIFLADTKCCAQDATTVAARPGWSNLAAVTAGNVVELDDDIVSRWGPRVVEFLETIITATNEIDAA